MNSHFRSTLNDRCFTLVPFRVAPDAPDSRRGGGLHPIMVYSGQVPPERGTFSRIHSVYERVEILLVELYFSSLRADVSKYRPEVYKSEKSKILKTIHKVALGKLLT